MDTVNGFDNVLYEVANEANPHSTEWQYYVIRYVKQYESSKPRQHPVGMTFQYKGGNNRTLFDSPADWVSPASERDRGDYLENPPSRLTGKIVLLDSDHLGGYTGDSIWVWKSFCRGLNVLFMDDMEPSPTWQDSARDAIGQVRRWSERVHLAAMVPSEDLCSTKYCLADRGREYLVFQKGDTGRSTVNLKDAPGEFAVEWFNVTTGATVAARSVRGGGARRFATPFPGPAVLYLRRLSDVPHGCRDPRRAANAW